jgi:hypothetical protein
MSRSIEELEAEITRLKQENRATKTKAVEVARKAAKKHNWCHVIDEVLEEAGLVGEMVEREVEMLVPVTIRCRVSAEQIEDDDGWACLARQAKVSGIIWELTGDGVRPLRGNNQPAAGDYEAEDIEIIDVREIPPPPPRVEGTPPAGCRVAFVSIEGRVRHYFREDAGYQDTALCGATSYFSRAVERSSRDSGRICKKCEERAANL